MSTVRRSAARSRTAQPRPASATARSRRRAAPATPDVAGRERILAAAIKAFSEVGYAGASTAGIARDAGVTQPLVHHHFGSKDGLWRAAMDAVFAEVPTAVAPSGAPAATILLETVERFIRFVATHPEATRIVAREGTTPSPRLDYLIERHLQAPFRQVVELIRAGQRGGMVAPEIRPDLLLFIILGAGSHLFDVTAFAARSVGIDAGSARTRDDFVALVRTLLQHGVVRAARR